MLNLFAVTYAIVTEESAADGEAAEYGELDSGLSLRDAVRLVHHTRTRHVGGVECIEANEMPVCSPSWITVHNSMEYLTGACEERSLHIPDGVTAASRRRIARLVGARV